MQRARQEIIIEPTKSHLRRSWSLVVIALGLPLATSHLIADDCADVVAKVVSVQGNSLLADSPLVPAQRICAEQLLAVGNNSRVAIRLTNTETVVRLGENSALSINSTSEGSSLLNLFEGVLHLFSRRPESFNIETPYINAGIDGTEFVMRSGKSDAEIIVIEGQVLASNPYGEILLEANEAAVARAGEAPIKRVVVDSGNAVRWALYYPPIDSSARTVELRTVVVALSRGRVEQALDMLADLPRSSESLALEAIIAVTLNRQAEALQLATVALSLKETVAAYIALSYAQQARFDIEAALDSVRQASSLNPQSVHALAREAELLLSLGRPDESQTVALRAVDISPNTARAHTVLGFVHLVQLDSARAKQEFNAAIAIDQVDPLPRLGLGLALIRQGLLVDGREQLEVAASLDPANSLIRSYLGKAYFEERLFPEAATQYKLAKQADSADPTPWFYEAVLAQTLNRPVQAYQSLQKATALNNYRLVYRSKLLVDSDAAAQSAGLARIYDELGFDQLAINQSERSLFQNPTNHAGHRFLADALATRERHELARRSVLFRSILLQPLTVNPVQPEAQGTDLLILPGSGPTHASDNEFNPLFDSDGFRLNASLLAGNQKTWGNQFVLAAQQGRLAYSAAQFHYETDGFRDNNDLTHDLGNVLVQYQPDPKVNLQLELQARQTDSGDFQQSFDPDDFSPDLRFEVQSTIPRIGVRLTPNNRTSILASLRAPEREETGRIPATTGFGTFIQAEKLKSDTLQPHLQFSVRGRRINHTFGIEGYRVKSRQTAALELRGQPCGTESGICSIDFGSETTRLSNGYYLAEFTTQKRFDWSLGASYTSADDEGGIQDLQEWYPTIGLRASLSPSVDLRLASTGGLGRGGGADVTLKPVILAGFNQLYDDTLGTRYRSHSTGLDWKISDSFFLGLEGTIRHLHVPIVVFNVGLDSILVQEEAQDEKTLRGYAYWLATATTSLSAALYYERFDREVLDGELLNTGYVFLPGGTETLSLPISVRYARPGGFFVRASVTPVAQDVELSPEVDFDTDSDRFVIVDVGLGYKFPTIRAALRFDVHNLFDTDFQFLDQSFRSADRSPSSSFSPDSAFAARAGTPRFSAERRMFMRLSISF